MALISKIRRNFWIVLILLGLALVSFIGMEAFGDGSGSGFLTSNHIGSIGGEKIDNFEFQNVERALFSGGQDQYANRASLWDYLVNNKISNKIGSKLGLGVGIDELKDLLFNPSNLSPVIQNAFRNPQTGEVNFQQLMDIKSALDKDQELAPDFKFSWAEQEKQVQSIKLQDKIATMVAKAMYTPSWQADLTNAFQSESADAMMLRIPFDYVSDADTKITDADFAAYIDKNKGRLYNENETRLVEFVAMDVTATPEDSAALRTKMQDLANQFSTTTSDSIFTATNNGMLSPVFNKLDDFNGEIKTKVSSLGIGQVTAPFIESGALVVAKLVDKKILPDSVKARHILKSTQGGVSIAKARASIDSIKALIVSGKQSFDSLAIKTSEDPGSATQGGDLGVFAQGRMVQPFNDACFLNSTEGGLYTVETQFGVHLIQVQKKIYVSQEAKYKVALISEAIVPSEGTQNKAKDAMFKLLSENRNIDALKKAADKAGMTVEVSRPISENDFSFQDLGSGQTSRDIVKWAFAAKPGEVAPTVYEYNDQANYYTRAYVIASLKQIDKPGLVSVAAAKSIYDIPVKNMKKAQVIMGKIKGNDLNAIASTLKLGVDSVLNVNYLNGSPELAGEAKVIAAILGLKQGATSKPIEGSNGVYVVKTIRKNPAIANNNNPILRQSLTNNSRSSVPFRLWPAIKKTVKIEDNRSRFY